VDLLFGRNAVLEALRGRRTARRLLVADGIQEDARVQEIQRLAAERQIPILRVPRSQIEDELGPVNHQGLALDAGPYPYVPFDDLIQQPGTLLILDHVHDPQNFGTLLRAAEAAGVSGIVMPRDRSVSVTGTVVNASAGAVEHLAIATVTNLGRAIAQMKGAGWWVAGLDNKAGALDLFDTDLPAPIALVIGSEGSGLSAGIQRKCDLLLSIPMRGRVASLNAATAGSLAVFEIFRRQRAEDLDPSPSS
jgi:23S rRNA (guanosine2251-2'-O)-methyltransferase